MQKSKNMKKMNSLYLSKNYKGLYESSCSCLRNSIINAIGELFIITGLEMFTVDRKNSIKVGESEFLGACIKSNHLHFVVLSDGKEKNIRIYDKQKDKLFKAFDSDIRNWINFIEKLKTELNKGIYELS